MKKRLLIPIVASLAAITLIATFTAVTGLHPQEASAAPEQDGANESLYVCTMHPWETSTEPGSCTTCGMGLSQVEGYTPGDPIPGEDKLFVNPDNPMKVSVTQHDGWIPITQSPFYQSREADEPAGHDHFMEEESGEMNHDSSAMEGMDHSQPVMGDELYVGAMHPWVQSHEPGTCHLCGMQLVKVEDWKNGDPMPEETDLFVDPDNPMKVSVTQHDGWIPIKQSPYYQPKSKDQPSHEDHGSQGHDADSGMDHSMQTRSSQESTASADSGSLWTCGMHPDVIQDEPGLCPICHMDLVPLKQNANAGTIGGNRKIKYWVAPMDPTYISDKPGKSPMGMDLVPVYEDEGGSAVSIDPVTLQNIGVVTVPAERTDLYRTIRSNGTVEVAEDNEIRVNARVSGWIEKLYVNRTGDPVRKGQTLLEIYSPELVSAQEEFIIALKNGETLSHSGIEHVSRGGTVLIEAARRRLQLWNIAESEIDRLEQTREVQRTLPLKAPSSGIVLHKNVVEGASVKAGMDLFTIADLGKVWVQAQVYEYELPWISVGDRVTVSSPYDPDLELSGTVDYIYPTLDARSRTAEIRVVLSTPDLELKPDMYVDVRVQANPLKNVVAVPKSAVIRSGERDIVFVKVGDGQFEPREVHLGLETDNRYEIADNLMAGESVVTSAQFLLDSEATLQEAIQRRIAQRMAMAQQAGE